MTLPDERYRALAATERFLMELCDSTATPRVPKRIRERAAACLRHYPARSHLDQLAACVPSVIDRDLEATERFILQGLSGFTRSLESVDKVQD
jgi:hypothetical protein